MNFRFRKLSINNLLFFLASPLFVSCFSKITKRREFVRELRFKVGHIYAVFSGNSRVWSGIEQLLGCSGLWPIFLSIFDDSKFIIQFNGNHCSSAKRHLS